VRPGLLSEIVTMGYEIFLVGEDIGLSYQKQDDPPEIARPLIHELKSYKTEVMEMLKNIGKHMGASPQILPEASLGPQPMAELIGRFEGTERRASEIEEFLLKGISDIDVENIFREAPLWLYSLTPLAMQMTKVDKI
jgi:hypothetical protein